jgi:protein SCO1/2
MKTKFSYYWLLFFLPLVFVLWYLNSVKENKPNHYLPYFGPKHAIKSSDTTYHQIPEFEFVNQYGEITNSATVSDKIYVAEFFFTTCHSICPIMNDNMKKLYVKFSKRPDVLILSHTVDPETDSVATLKNYADEHSVTDHRWLFLTGTKPKLYGIARKGYLLDANEGNGDEDDFIHTQNFALIDKDRHIRGYYDGTDSVEVDRLIKDINLLTEEYDYKNKTTH